MNMNEQVEPTRAYLVEEGGRAACLSQAKTSYLIWFLQLRVYDGVHRQIQWITLFDRWLTIIRKPLEDVIFQLTRSGWI